MKKTKKTQFVSIVGIIVVLAMIGFGLTACGGDEEEGLFVKIVKGTSHFSVTEYSIELLNSSCYWQQSSSSSSDGSWTNISGQNQSFLYFTAVTDNSKPFIRAVKGGVASNVLKMEENEFPVKVTVPDNWIGDYDNDKATLEITKDKITLTMKKTLESYSSYYGYSLYKDQTYIFEKFELDDHVYGSSEGYNRPVKRFLCYQSNGAIESLAIYYYEDDSKISHVSNGGNSIQIFDADDIVEQ